MKIADHINLPQICFSNLHLVSTGLAIITLCLHDFSFAAAGIEEQSSTREAGLECPIYDTGDPLLKAERKQKIRQQIARAQNFELGNNKRLAQCQLPVSKLLSAPGSAKPLLIDIRRANEFRSFHIPGSLNLPGKKVLTSRQWQRKKIVLIDHGHSYSRIDRLCQDMRDSGFKQVFVLDGGIRTWQASGQNLAGTSPADRGIAEMKAQEFFAESRYAHWMLLMPEGKLPEGLNKPGSHIVTVQSNGKNSLTRLKQDYARYRDNLGADPIILVVADDFGEREKLQDMAQQVSSLAFSLQGGSANYHAHLRKQQVIWNYQPGIKRSKQCGR